MDDWNENNHVFNIRLAKLTGLFQILNPETIKFLGRNVYHIVATIILLYTGVMSIILNASSLYYWADNIILSVDYGWKGIIAFFTAYKMWNVVYHSNDIWDCLAITRYDFTSQNLRNRHILDRWRERSVWITNTLAIVYLFSVALFTGSSYMFRDSISTVNNHDGSVGNYRQNLFNLYLLVTDETYNAHYDTFYFIETLYIVGVTTLFIAFDVLLVTLCLAVSCQMQMVNVAFESVGNKSLSDPHTPSIGEYMDFQVYISKLSELCIKTHTHL